MPPVEGGTIWRQTAGRGRGVPLLMLHGGPEYPHDYLEALSALGNERPVIFYDQLGRGKSDRPADLRLWRADWHGMARGEQKGSIKRSR